MTKLCESLSNGVDDMLRASMFNLFVDDGDNAMVGLVMMMIRIKICTKKN